MSKLNPAFDCQSNVIVRASAGSGKTFLLVARILNILMADHKPESILAITFTRKAAGEMLDRLQQQLKQFSILDDNELVKQLKKYGCPHNKQSMQQARRLHESVLRNKDSLRIDTFHSFCQSILHRFPLEAAIAPGFEVAESIMEYLQQAWDELVYEATLDPDGETGQALTSLFEHCGGLHGTRELLFSFIDHRNDWWAYASGCRRPQEQAVVELVNYLDIDTEKDLCTDFFQKHGDRLKQTAMLLRRHPTTTNVQAAQNIEDAVNAAPPAALHLVKKAFFNKNGYPLSRKRTKVLEQKLGPQDADALLSNHDFFTNAIQSVSAGMERQKLVAVQSAWLKAGVRLLDYYQKTKEEQRVLDFNDLEWKTYSLLQASENALWLQYKLDQRIDHVLVDEFQDTNPTQWRLILPLLEEMASGEKHNRSVFLVGDTKQSIYSFRRAEPKLFQTAADWLVGRLDAQTVELHYSWRSAPVIMEFVNTVFTPMLDAFPQHDTHKQHLWGGVELHPLSHREQAIADIYFRNPLDHPRPETGNQSALAEGELIVRRIQALIENQTAVEDNDGVRAAHYGDVMILVRSRTHLWAYERSLMEAGIPFMSGDRGGLLDSLEIGDLMALLTFLNAPMNDLSLARVLKSPVCHCSDNDLILLSQQQADTWHEKLLALAATDQASQAVDHAARQLNCWLTLSGHVPVHDLLDKIYQEGNVLDRYTSAYPRHLRPRVRANLNRFLELALEIDSGRYPSLGKFLTRLKTYLTADENGLDQAPASTTENRVRILTVHSAKGLEAPIVILADTNHSIQQHKSYDTCVHWPAEEHRPGRFSLCSNANDERIQSLSAPKDATLRRESLNLLYVALTRAKQYLIITGQKSARIKQDSWYALLCRQLELDPDSLEACWRLSKGQPPAAPEQQVQSTQPEQPIVKALTMPLPVDDSVIEIAPSRSGDTESLIAGENQPDGAQGRLRGRIIHRFLQLLHSSVKLGNIQARVADEFHLADNDALITECLNEAAGLAAHTELGMLFDSKRYQKAFNEVPVAYTMNERNVYGIIDRLVLFENEAIVVDYKTTVVTSKQQAQAIAENYREQLFLYVEGAKRLWPKKQVRGLILFTHNGEFVEMP